MSTGLNNQVAVSQENEDSYTPKNYTIGKNIFRRAFVDIKRVIRTYIIFAIIGGLLTIVINSFLPLSLSTLIFLAISSFVGICSALLILNKTQGFADTINVVIPIFLPFFMTVFIAQLVVEGGFILLIIPGILMALAFSVLPFIIIEENKRGLAALQRCCALVKKFRGNIFGAYLMLFLSILLIFIGLFVIGLAFIAIFSKLLDLGTTGSIFVFSLSLLIGLIPTIIFPILYVAFGKVLYEDLVKIRPVGTNLATETKSKPLILICMVLGILVFASYLF